MSVNVKNAKNEEVNKMFAIVSKKSKYKKYGNIVALILDNEEQRFVVAYNYIESEHSKCFGNTPAENVFVFENEEQKHDSLIKALEKYDSIKCD